jgi:ubiquinone/menaquinone biosynthesis C-methylase UbiE
MHQLEAGAVLLYDAAESTRARLKLVHGTDPRIRVVGRTEHEVAADSIDLVLVNSVIQYLSEAELDVALARFWSVLRPGGALLIGDVISPGTPALRHVTTFLGFAARRGFLPAAVGGLAQTFVSPYRRLQKEVGLAAYTPAQMLAKLERAGFAAEQLPRNIAVSPHRSSYLARKRAGVDATARPAATS